MNLKNTSFSRIEGWINEIDKITLDFKKTTQNLTHAQLNWKVNKQTWSIAQNMEHLIVVNESYFPILHQIRTGKYKTPFLGKFKFITKTLGSALLKSVQRKKKTKTFHQWKPTQEEEIKEIFVKFEKHQEELKQQIEEAEDILKKGAVIASPANKNIIYTLEAAFDIIINHEKRHLQQTKEVLKTLLKQ
ncbi:MAG TPA: DinB family protein [Sphingobacterium sp.]|nr:DinB family protein [Sphingobacterium sp.]